MTSAQTDNRIEMINGAPVFRLRDRLLPLVSLSELLQISDWDKTDNEMVDALPQPSNDLDAPVESETVDESGEIVPAAPIEELNGADINADATLGKNQYIVVTQVGAYDFGIIVDKVFDTEEIVVKPVANILRDLDLFSGNTILGDGTVIMILDPNGIARATGEIETADSMDMATADVHESSKLDKTSLLLFSAYDDSPKAVPLSLVARLEQIKMADIENSGGQMMVQYRDELMPLQLFHPSMDISQSREKPVLVFTDKSRSLGIIVDDIIDIKEERVDLQVNANKPGLQGSAIIDGKATDIIDVIHYLNASYGEWFKDHDDTPFISTRNADGSESSKRVLLVDDSPFFRNMLTPILNVAGYSVTSLESPIAALERCESGEQFDVIISDIEMPGMNGFEFAEKVKTGSNWQDTPMVALTSHATPEDINRGKAVGFEGYVAKFDRDTLLNTLTKTLSNEQGQAA